LTKKNLNSNNNGNNAASKEESNATSYTKNSEGNTRDYVSGDSARSSSSHQFHKNVSDKTSIKDYTKQD
jgi:hypothetical protein